MFPVVRAAGRRLRRYVLPLVGYWDIAARLDALGVPALDAEVGSSARVGGAVLSDQFAALEKHLETVVGAEVDRLDGYLVHHAAALRAELTVLQEDFRAAKVEARIDQVDRQLSDHIGTLRAELAALKDEVRRHQRTRVCAAEGVGILMLTQDFDIVLPPQEVGLLAFLMRHGPEVVEGGVCAVLRERLRKGDAAVDGGANIGLHALTMARAVGPAGRVICFEPIPHVADALAWTLRLNGFADYACIERAALSDKLGEATLHVAPHSPSSSLFALADSTGSLPIAVSTTSLDSALAPGSRLKLVKLDIEGAEPSAWRGMRRVRQESPELDIVLEWSSSHFARSGESAAEFYHTIRAEGYSLFVIEDAPQAGRLAAVADVIAVAALEGVNLLLTRRP
jgi:FkbM family methyltransferase